MDKVIKKIDYPFLDTFVLGMMTFGGQHHVRNDQDLKSLLVFMVMFKDTIKELDYDGFELSYKNITSRIKTKFRQDRLNYVMASQRLLK